MATLDEFMAQHDWATHERLKGWKVSRTGKIVRLSLAARDGETFTLQCVCDNYPGQAPSVAFVDSEGSKGNARSWPTGGKAITDIVKPPPNSFLCMSLTREGLQHHKNWIGNPKQNPWDPAKHSLMSIFNVVHRLLMGPDYTGRVA